MASFILLAYTLAGFFGVGMLAIGLLSSIVTILSINFLSGFSEDGLKCAKIARTYG
jgi:Na+/H+-translocating membrane pyrophosphatase